MKTLPLIIASLWLVSACSSKGTLNLSTGGAASNGNDEVVVVAQAFAQQIAAAEQPAVNQAVAKLPVETQALAQAAYAALLRALDEAVTQGVGALSPAAHADAQAAVEALGAAAEFLHGALHDPNTVSNGKSVLQPADPNVYLLPSAAQPNGGTFPVILPSSVLAP